MHLVFLAAAGVALVVIVRSRTMGNLPKPTASTMPPAPSPGIEAMARAIARAEGFYVPGSIPQRAHNPGNIKVPGSTRATINGITVFENDGEGWAQLYKQLNLIATGRSSVYSANMSILDMGNKWAPHGGADFNIKNAWATNVAAQLGVPASTRIGALLA